MVACSPDKCDIRGKDNMENTMINRIIPLIILLVAGCATQTAYTPTYQTSLILDTNPQGATVICNDQDYGYSPVITSRTKNTDFVGENRPLTDKDIAQTLEYFKILRGELKVGENKALTDEATTQLIESQKNIQKEANNTEECIAYWSSGVSKKYSFPFPYIYAGEGKFIYTLQRPEGEGYSQDAEFALKVKQLQQDQNNANRNASIGISAVQAQQRAAKAQERAAAAQEYQNTKSTTCTTTLGITRCY